jgi:hypothetical protein
MSLIVKTGCWKNIFVLLHSDWREVELGIKSKGYLSGLLLCLLRHCQIPLSSRPFHAALWAVSRVFSPIFDVSVSNAIFLLACHKNTN